jgi:hypothetical protein
MFMTCESSADYLSSFEVSNHLKTSDAVEVGSSIESEERSLKSGISHSNATNRSQR